MADTITKVVQGALATQLGSPDDAQTAKQLCRPHMMVVLEATNLGAAAEEILIGYTHCDITVLDAYMVASEALAMDANNPDFAFAYASSIGGSATDLHTTNIDGGAAGAITEDTKYAATLTTTAVPAGSYIYLLVETNGTPADITEASKLTFVLEYEHTN